VHPALRALTPRGSGELAVAIGRTRLGAAQRAWLRVPLMFARPHLAPPSWLAEHKRLATLPHHLPTTLAALRTQVGPFGQRHLLLHVLPRLRIPTLLLWGAQDAVLPVAQARAALSRIQDGRLVVIPRCGHLPQLERPERFTAAVAEFLTG
jgi:pimeloyl-ACP methyl ester carboxylesterase